MKKERPQRVWVPHLQIRSNSIIRYAVPDPPPTGGRFHKNTYSGKVTDGARRRITRTLDLLVQKSPIQTVFNPVTERDITFRLNFITLTISAKTLIPHREAYAQGLRKWLDWATYAGLRDYIWKAELQARGQIHWHITGNRFFDLREVRDSWNVLQRKAGWLAEFEVEKGHWNANSTDIHAVRNDADIVRYLGKYIAKAETEKAKIDGKVWGASRSLTGKKLFSCETVEHNESEFERIEKTQAETVVHLENCSIYRNAQRNRVLTKQQEEEYKSYLASLNET